MPYIDHQRRGYYQGPQRLSTRIKNSDLDTFDIGGGAGGGSRRKSRRSPKEQKQPKKKPPFRPRKYWVRPIDGQRRGARGRFMDVLTSEGPDVFVVINGDHRKFWDDVPHRGWWSRWGDSRYVRGDDETSASSASSADDEDERGDEDEDEDEPDDRFDWRTSGRGSAGTNHRHQRKHYTLHRSKREGTRYNFCSRQYEDEAERREASFLGRLWSDVRWDEARAAKTWRKDKTPWSYRAEGRGKWRSRVPWWAGAYEGAKGSGARRGRWW